MGSNNSEIHGYDASGNQYVFTWDDEDRLASTTLPEGHTDGNAYTGLGMRLSKTDGGVGYAYLCDGVSPASPVLSDGLLSFTPGISQTLGTPNGSGGLSYASHFYAEDAVGNLRGMSDAGVLRGSRTGGAGTGSAIRWLMRGARRRRWGLGRRAATKRTRTAVCACWGIATTTAGRGASSARTRRGRAAIGMLTLATIR